MSIEEKFQNIKKKILDTAQACNRNSDAIKLVAVSKRQPEDRIDIALNAGHRTFGENKVQEAKERWEKRCQLYPDLKLHLIGPLQTNKVKDAVSLFDVIETIDRPKLVKALATEIKNQDKDIECFIQVNTGEEGQKSGVFPKDLDDLLDLCKKKELPISGLMCIPPINEPAGIHFSFLKTLADKHGIKKLSMGMSSDYKEAILSGSTEVRIGSTLFGERD